MANHDLAARGANHDRKKEAAKQRHYDETLDEAASITNELFDELFPTKLSAYDAVAAEAFLVQLRALRYGNAGSDPNHPNPLHNQRPDRGGTGSSSTGTGSHRNDQRSGTGTRTSSGTGTGTRTSSGSSSTGTGSSDVRSRLRGLVRRTDTPTA